MGKSPGMTTTEVRDMVPPGEPVLNRVITFDSHPLPIDIVEPTETEVTLSNKRRYVVTFLILLCNLTQVPIPNTRSVLPTTLCGFED